MIVGYDRKEQTRSCRQNCHYDGFMMEVPIRDLWDDSQDMVRFTQKMFLYYAYYSVWKYVLLAYHNGY